MSKIILFLLLAGQLGVAHAADSYRWLHVTIDTPWAIFIFLLPMVLIPIVLMAILYWKYAFQAAKNTEEEIEQERLDNKGDR